MIEPTETKSKLFEALAKAQGEMDNAIKNSENPFFKSNYADLASVMDACRGPLSKNGLCIIQTIRTEQGKMLMTTMLCHSSGEVISSEMPIVPADNKLTSIGSAITYLRRFMLAPLVGVAAEEKNNEETDDDDDGNQASGHNSTSVGSPKKQGVKPPLPPEIAVKPKTPRRAKPIASDLDYAAKRATYAKIIALEKELNISNENMVTFLQNQFETDSADLLTLAEMNVAIIELEKMRTIINPADATWAQNHSTYLGDEKDVK